MRDLSIQSQKLSLIQWLSQLEDRNVIKSILKIKEKNTKKEFSPIELTVFNKEIDKAMDDSKNNRIIKAKDLKSKYA